MSIYSSPISFHSSSAVIILSFKQIPLFKFLSSSNNESLFIRIGSFNHFYDFDDFKLPSEVPSSLIYFVLVSMKHYPSSSNAYILIVLFTNSESVCEVIYIPVELHSFPIEIYYSCLPSFICVEILAILLLTLLVVSFFVFYSK